MLVASACDKGPYALRQVHLDTGGFSAACHGGSGPDDPFCGQAKTCFHSHRIDIRLEALSYGHIPSHARPRSWWTAWRSPGEDVLGMGSLSAGSVGREGRRKTKDRTRTAGQTLARVDVLHPFPLYADVPLRPEGPGRAVQVPERESGPLPFPTAYIPRITIPVTHARPTDSIGVPSIAP